MGLAKRKTASLVARDSNQPSFELASSLETKGNQTSLAWVVVAFHCLDSSVQTGCSC